MLTPPETYGPFLAILTEKTSLTFNEANRGYQKHHQVFYVTSSGYVIALRMMQIMVPRKVQMFVVHS